MYIYDKGIQCHSNYSPQQLDLKKNTHEKTKHISKEFSHRLEPNPILRHAYCSSSWESYVKANVYLCYIL